MCTAPHTCLLLTHAVVWCRAYVDAAQETFLSLSEYVQVWHAFCGALATLFHTYANPKIG